jgi:hypothetical protein
MKTLTVQDRNGYWLETVRVQSDMWKSTPHERSERKRIVEKYNGGCYIFAATPSEGISGPLRKPGARSFVMGAE